MQIQASMFAFLVVLFVVLWLTGFVAFHVAGWFIHLFLLLALISLILHVFRPRRVV